MNGAQDATFKVSESQLDALKEPPSKKVQEKDKKYRRLVHHVNVSTNKCDPISGPAAIDMRTKKVVQVENPKVEGKK